LASLAENKFKLSDHSDRNGKVVSINEATSQKYSASSASSADNISDWIPDVVAQIRDDGGGRAKKTPPERGFSSKQTLP
jgi:hypothetical protein